MGRKKKFSEDDEKAILEFNQKHGQTKTLKEFKIDKMLLHRIKLRHPAINYYQREIWGLQQQIFACPCLQLKTQDNCREDIPKEILTNLRSPDSIYIGKYYGSKKFPKILFIGNNPNIDFQDFGPLGTINECLKQDLTEIYPEHFYSTYFSGVNTPKYYGIKDFPLYKNKKWSIHKILTNLFPQHQEVVDGFAYTNGVLCMGSKQNGAPTSRMRKNCIVNNKWLRKTLDIISPDLIFIFSIAQQESTWSWWTEEKGVVDHWENLDPPVDYAFYSQFKEGNSKKILTIGIPHLTAPRFQTWSSNIPIIYRSLFNLVDEDIITRILSQIKILVDQKLIDFIPKLQEEQHYRMLWTRFFYNYDKIGALRPLKYKLRKSISTDGFKSVSLGVEKRLTIDLYINKKNPQMWIQFRTMLQPSVFKSLMKKFTNKYQKSIQMKIPSDSVSEFRIEKFKSEKMSKTFNIVRKVLKNTTQEEFLTSSKLQDELLGWGITVLDQMYQDLSDFAQQELN